MEGRGIVGGFRIGAGAVGVVCRLHIVRVSCIVGRLHIVRVGRIVPLEERDACYIWY